MAAGEATGNQVATRALTIRPCKGLPEMRACVELQKEVWSFTDIELVPLRMFVVAEKIGGQVIGAFDAADLVGFAFAIPGARNRHSYLHSHMLGVRRQYRDAGLGRRIKLFQREDALARGFELIEWTYDPLEIKNAYLNLEKLGAISRRYNINQYGITSSPLQAGLPTDRLIAEWWIKSRRVTQLLAAGTKPDFKVLKTIGVPGQIYEWKRSEAEKPLARSLQDVNREEFLTAFSQGLSVLGYHRGQNGDGKFLLGRWDESWAY